MQQMHELNRRQTVTYDSLATAGTARLSAYQAYQNMNNNKADFLQLVMVAHSFRSRKCISYSLQHFQKEWNSSEHTKLLFVVGEDCGFEQLSLSLSLTCVSHQGSREDDPLTLSHGAFSVSDIYFGKWNKHGLGQLQHNIKQILKLKIKIKGAMDVFHVSVFEFKTSAFI